MIRPAAAAGTFYPDDAAVLARTVDDLLGRARGPGPPARPAAIVVPHAAYAYSGPVAASAFASLDERWAPRVVLLGPAHFVPLRGIAAPTGDAWWTPLGEVGIDRDLRAAAVSAGAVLDDEPQAPEHALEVQLPFIVRTLGTVRVLPLAVGATSPDRVADLIEALVGPADLVVVSTDLSHYLDDPTARRIDRRTAAAAIARDESSIPDGAACGVDALRGIVAFARRRDLPVRLLDLRTSGDTSGDRRRVVGYGAFAIG